MLLSRIGFGMLVYWWLCVRRRLVSRFVIKTVSWVMFL